MKRADTAIEHAYRALFDATPEQLREMSCGIARTGVSADEALAALAELRLATPPEHREPS